LADYTSTGCANVFITPDGLEHLEGQTVAILADGAVATQEVVTSGAITAEGAEIHVGLPYTSEMETLNIDVDTKTGTLQGKHVKISNVTYRLLNSRGGYVGPNKDVTYDAFSSTSLDKATEIADIIGGGPYLYNVDVRVPLGAGYEKGGRMYYKQTDPLPITITAVIPEVTID